jgi:hypothetical protein
METCSRGKKQFASRKDAEIHATKINDSATLRGSDGKKERLSAYHCKECKHYHVGAVGKGLARLREFRRAVPTRVHQILCLEEDDEALDKALRPVRGSKAGGSND